MSSETVVETNGNQLAIGVRFEKVDVANRTVEGFATLDNVDTGGDIVDFNASRQAFSDWVGNIREMHSPLAVGKALAVEERNMTAPDGNEYKGVYVRAYISRGAQDTWEKVLDGTLQGFSIGGRVQEKRPETVKSATGPYQSIRVNRITKYKLGELSVVDNPANPLAMFDKITKMQSTSLMKYVQEGREELQFTDAVGITERDIRYCKSCDSASVFTAPTTTTKCGTCANDLILVATAYEQPTAESVQKMVFDYFDLEKLQTSDAGKVDPGSVEYIPAVGAASCATCIFFVAGQGICEKVAGPISPNYVCDLHEVNANEPPTPAPIEVYNNVTQKTETGVTKAAICPACGEPAMSEDPSMCLNGHPMPGYVVGKASMPMASLPGHMTMPASAGGHGVTNPAMTPEQMAATHNQMHQTAAGHVHKTVTGEEDLQQNTNHDKNINKLFEDFVGAIASKIQTDGFEKTDGGDFEKVDNQALESIRDVLKSAFANVEDILTKAGVVALNNEDSTDVSVATSASLPAPISYNAEPGQPDASGTGATADVWAAPPPSSNVLPHVTKSEEVSEVKVEAPQEVSVEKAEKVDEGELVKTIITDELTKFSTKTVEALDSITNSVNEISNRVNALETSGAAKKSGEVNEELTKSEPKSFWAGAFSPGTNS